MNMYPSEYSPSGRESRRLEIAFYSRPRQILREIRGLWRANGRWELPFGVALGLLSFYVLHRPGGSQVYDVVLPFAAISAYIAFGIVAQVKVEMEDRSATYFANLPRRHAFAFDGKVIWYSIQATLYGAAIGLGCWLKLGGAGITPIYRLHPEMVVLPYATVFYTLWLIHQPPGLEREIRGLVSCFLAFGGLIVWYTLLPNANVENHWLPPRMIPLGAQYVLALGMLGISAWLGQRARSRPATVEWLVEWKR